MDRRIKYTKKVIKETFLELLEEKEITKITVLELCKKADINRATFYRYYLDIFDLLEKLEEEFVDELRQSYKSFNTVHNQLYDYVFAILKGCYNNKKFVKIIFKTKKNILFLDKIFEDAYTQCEEKWKNTIPNISQEEIEYTTIFIFNGTIGVINYWILNNFDKNIEDVAEIITELCFNGINKFIYKK